MILKQIPDDFIVKEVPDYSESHGSYSIFLLRKRDYTTEKAIQTICNSLHIIRKRVGYAGIKDRHAITEQYISINKIKKEKVESLSLKDISLEFVAYSDNPISLGDLKGNYFEITVRRLDKNIKIKPSRVKNFFDDQRFSKNNVEIGRAILKKQFGIAVEKLLEGTGDYEGEVRAFLDKNPNNYVGALRKVPLKILLLFVHSYQSKIFNETISQLDIKENIKVPLVGFGVDYENDDIRKIIKSILKQGGISERDFIIQSIPEISCEGAERSLYTDAKDFKSGKLEKDELNPGKWKIKLSFSLPKGSYATNFLKQILSTETFI